MLKYLCFLKKLVVALLEIYHMYNSQFNMVICIGQKSFELHLHHVNPLLYCKIDIREGAGRLGQGVEQDGLSWSLTALVCFNCYSVQLYASVKL